jgi:hypothetical protein
MESSLGKLLTFLDRLEAHDIYYTLDHVRDSVMVTVAVPGQRWEVEFFEDSHVEVEIFTSSKDGLEDESVLEKLFSEFAD